jgi:hypothetical protein
METNLTRRKALGGIAALTAGGLGTAALAAGPAAAQSYTISDASVTLDAGEASFVGVDVTGTLSWDGFDEGVDRLEFVSEVKVAGEEWHELNRTTSDPLEDWSGDGDSDGWGGAGEYVLENGGDGDGTAGEVHTTAKWAVIAVAGADTGEYRTSGLNVPDWTAALDAATDGSSETTSVSKRSTVRFLDADGNTVGVGETSESTSFDVTVNNQPSTSGGSTDGDSTVQ